MQTRRLVARVLGKVDPLRVRHYVGTTVPGSEGDDRVLMPWPDWVLIEPDDQDPSTVFLYRYTNAGEFCGDTWHESLDDAKAQAEFEFATHLGAWEAVPDDVEDMTAFLFRPR